MTTEAGALPQLPTEEIAAFRRDGVVALRRAFSVDWIEVLRRGIEADLERPSPNLGNHCKDPAAPAYWEDFWCWSHFPEFERFVRESPCAGIAAQLLGAERVNLVMDNWFLREAGSRSRHQSSRALVVWKRSSATSTAWLRSRSRASKRTLPSSSR